jgi:hypothetical protein
MCLPISRGGSANPWGISMTQSALQVPAGFTTECFQKSQV